MPQMNRPTRNLSAPDTTTPLATEMLPDPPSAPAVELPKVELRTTVEHRGRAFVIVASGMTLDQFCDLLDRRGYAPVAQTQEWQRLPDGTPICPKHHSPMRAREKQGDTWYSHNVGTKEQPIYCKGYHGKDSPGYEVDR
jgi:hypothetical protein